MQPDRGRTCSGFEAGKAGIEQWARLNEAALRGKGGE